MLNQETAAPELPDVRDDLDFVGKARGCTKGGLHFNYWYADDAILLEHLPLDQACFLEEGRGAVIEERKITREIHNLGGIAIAPLDRDPLTICQMWILAHQSNRTRSER